MNNNELRVRGSRLTQCGTNYSIEKVTVPVSEIEEAIADAVPVASKTGKPQFVRVMAWDGLYASIGRTDDPEMQIGRHWATVHPDGKIERLWE